MYGFIKTLFQKLEYYVQLFQQWHYTCYCPRFRDDQENEFRIKVRITFKRQGKYYSTGKSITKEDWEKLSSTRNAKLIEIRNDLENSFSKLKKIIIELEEENSFTLENFNTRLSRGSFDTLNEAFEFYLYMLQSEDRIGIYRSYKDALASFEHFSGKAIALADINVTWLKRYERHSINKGISYTTIGIRCRSLRSVINDAIRLGQLQKNQYPFGKGKYEIPKAKSRKMALNLEQISKIVKYSDGNQDTERYRDLWFFSYLCNGANFADILRFRYSNIVNGELFFLPYKNIPNL